MGNVLSLRLLGYFSGPLSGLLISFSYPKFCSGIFGIFIYSLPAFYWGNLFVWGPLSAFTNLAPLRPISSFPRLFSELCVTFVFGLTCFYLYLILTPTSSVLEQVISCSKVFRLFKGITRTSDASSILKCRSRQVCFHSTKINFKSDQKYWPKGLCKTENGKRLSRWLEKLFCLE